MSNPNAGRIAVLTVSAAFSMIIPLAVPAAPLVLENGYVRIAVSPQHGGFASSLFFERAISFPYIQEKGAGIAGSGELFGIAIEPQGRTTVSPEMRVQSSAPAALVLWAPLPQIHDGLTLTRRFRLSAGGSSLAIEDIFSNDSASDVNLRVAGSSRQQAEDWRLTDRSWIGDTTTAVGSHTPVKDAPAPVVLDSRGGAFFWRQIEQYGTGFLYRVRIPVAGVQIREEVQQEKGDPVRMSWRSHPITIPAHGKFAIHSEVIIDEGGGPPDERNAFAPLLVRSDTATAGRCGEPLVAFAMVVSPQPRNVRIAIDAAGREVAHADVRLEPGKVARVPAVFTPQAKGKLPVRVTVSEAGKEIAGATAVPLIDGDDSDPAWTTFSGKMPEENYHGTWREIGEQLARNAGHIGAPSTVSIVPRKNAAPSGEFAFYQSHFPYYAEMLSGAAETAGVPPDRLAFVDRTALDRSACMDIAFYGPDGPINAFSKERSGTSFKGLGYIKVVPSKGYAFHTYMGVGVNSEGLSISSATLNEDDRTRAAAARELQDWRQAGKHVLPQAAKWWMVLSMARNVDEALTLIESPDAPLEQTGNILLVDRAGNAARIESAGIKHQVFRGNASAKGFLTAGNYPHQASDGLFGIGSRAGWAANTMFREHFLENFVGDRQGHLSLQDVITLMQTHEAGGMCQHLYDNPGVLYTSCSFLAVTKTSELWLSQGPPCQNHYERHTLP